MSDNDVLDEVLGDQSIDSASDDGDVNLTAAEVIQLLEEMWLNEKFAPEILPHKKEVVDCLLVQISHMEENLKNITSTDFLKSIHQLEVDRLRFLVCSYLRSRIEKIEKYVFAIVKAEEERLEKNQEAYLTEDELEFARGYKESEFWSKSKSMFNKMVVGIEQHFRNVLDFGPDHLRPDDWKNEVPSPNINSFVFAKSKKDIEGVIIDEGNGEEGDLVDLRTGSQLLISYNSIANLVKNGDVSLI